MKKSKENIKVRDLSPKKDAKGGVSISGGHGTSPVISGHGSGPAPTGGGTSVSNTGPSTH
jgi:hypothetical protein